MTRAAVRACAMSSMCGRPRSPFVDEARGHRPGSGRRHGDGLLGQHRRPGGRRRPHGVAGGLPESVRGNHRPPMREFTAGRPLRRFGRDERNLGSRRRRRPPIRERTRYELDLRGQPRTRPRRVPNQGTDGHAPANERRRDVRPERAASARQEHCHRQLVESRFGRNPTSWPPSTVPNRPHFGSQIRQKVRLISATASSSSSAASRGTGPGRRPRPRAHRATGASSSESRATARNSTTVVAPTQMTNEVSGT